MPTPVIVILIVVGVLAIFSVFFGIVGVPFIVSKKVYEHQKFANRNNFKFPRKHN